MTDTPNTTEQPAGAKLAGVAVQSGNGLGNQTGEAAPPPAVPDSSKPSPDPVAQAPADAIRVSVVKGPETEERAVKASVAGMKVGSLDGRNSRVDRVFYKFEDYAILLSAGEVRIQYSDDPDKKKAQIDKVAELIPLRERLQYLANEPDLKERYLPQIADAFFLALQDKKDCAKQVLDDAVKDIQDVRTRDGRITYVKCAVGLGIGLAAVLFFLGEHAFHKAQVVPLWAAAGSGSIGALLSIALALRGRTVATDGDWRTNIVDVAIRLLIGVISAAALYLILSSGIMANMQVGELKLSGGAISWQIALVIGFLAGFVERLVPDLLEKKPAPANK